MASRYFSQFPEKKLGAPTSATPSPGTKSGPTKRDMPMKTVAWPTTDRVRGVGYKSNGAASVKTHNVKRGCA